MLRDLFFNIWHDDTGYNWFAFVLALFFICLVVLIVYFIRLKKGSAKFKKPHLISLGIAAIIMYQVIPPSLDFYANIVVGALDYKKNHSVTREGISKSIKYEKMAINTSIIPWQKGGYYCKIATLYNINGDYKNSFASLKQAYKYVKSHKYPCWGVHYLAFYAQGNYDTAIEIAENSKITRIHPYTFISHCYIMKGDLKNAELYIDKAMKAKENYENLATKAYILKEKGQVLESLTYYKKALQLCKKEKQKIKAGNIYRNFVEYENKRVNSLLINKGG